MGDAWNPAQYERFRRERELPFWDLLALVQQRRMRLALDLGCGTGALTAAMHDALRPAMTIGIDSSAAMLERTAQVTRAGLRFDQADLAEWQPPEAADLVVSNAALQWVDDHLRLLHRLREMLAPGGQLAVQMPANFDHQSHSAAAAVAAEHPYAEALGGYTRTPPVLPPEAYAQLLHDLGFSEQIVRLQVYPHELESTGAVVEWVRGSLLTDYEVRMPAQLFARFVNDYRARLLDALGDARPYLYCFKRLLFWGSLPRL